MDGITIRSASPDDAQALLAIYAPYVEQTAISFEYDVPTLAEFRGRIERTLQSYPYLVAERDGRIVGYAYAHIFHGREAYRWSVELAVYVDRAWHRSGVGKALYAALEARLREMGVVNLYACITAGEEGDPYLTGDSLAFHAHMGFKTVARFCRCGCKFGRWYDTVWMEKTVGEHIPDPPPVKKP